MLWGCARVRGCACTAELLCSGGWPRYFPFNDTVTRIAQKLFGREKRFCQAAAADQLSAGAGLPPRILSWVSGSTTHSDNNRASCNMCLSQGFVPSGSGHTCKSLMVELKKEIMQTRGSSKNKMTPTIKESSLMSDVICSLHFLS